MYNHFFGLVQGQEGNCEGNQPFVCVCACVRVKLGGGTQEIANLLLVSLQNPNKGALQN